MKKVELLAPAGSFDSFSGAIHAGADAVYLGGAKYGARAFAENFDEETLCRAIYYAHLFQRKVYLTLNTLMKQSELEDVVEFLTPFYLAGLDGVIVQDLGLFSLIKKHFPLLELHISTQMAVTGPLGVRFLKEQGAVRVVPARELSLAEIKSLKKEGLEIETFIHGAMCYCYSGQCFFSSFLGGRSGNRGKCAQPCRLPYEVNLLEDKTTTGKKETYPLSLKDMCSIELLPQLLLAGIDSFKIEGRMKRPEYVAGVTAIYRKYIDRCYQNGLHGIRISEEDWNVLRSLYIRSDIQDGYYKRHNGREMVTLHKPGYSGMDDALASSIYEKYVKTPLKAAVSGFITLKKYKPVKLQLYFGDKHVCCQGNIVEEAQKRPVSREDVEKQLKKTGNTDFIFSFLEIDMDSDIFLPLKSLNELRREAFLKLEEELKQEISAIRQKSLDAVMKSETKNEVLSMANGINQSINSGENSKKQDYYSDIKVNTDNKIQKCNQNKKLYLSVSTIEQCQKACQFSDIQRLYVAGDLLLADNNRVITVLKEYSTKQEVWIKLPEVLREKDYVSIDKIIKHSLDFTTGMLVSNLESYSYLKYHNYNGQIALNHHLYVWNQEAILFWKDKAASFSAPVECSYREWNTLQDENFEYLCYGRIPMMVTANCVRKTTNRCRGKGVSFGEGIRDRYQTDFPVQVNCNYCYNIIYNSVPLSYHQYLEQIRTLSGTGIRLEFTTETGEELIQITTEYVKFLKKKEYDFTFLKDYTTGHYKKGAL